MAMLFDLHVHTDISPCSKMSLEDAILHAKECGLDGICITDHHSMAGMEKIKEGPQSNGVCVIFGMEYSTAQGDFLIFGPYQHLPKGLDALDLLAYVRATGGVAIGAHPFRRGRSIREDLFRTRFVKVAEGMNGRNNSDENQVALTRLPRYGTALVGGSDAHQIEELGRVKTELPIKVLSKRDFIEAIRYLEDTNFPVKIYS